MCVIGNFRVDMFSEIVRVSSTEIDASRNTLDTLCYDNF